MKIILHINDDEASKKNIDELEQLIEDNTDFVHYFEVEKALHNSKNN